MVSRQITPSYQPLPPQRWGFLATNQFWVHASLTPISIIFWAGAAVFFTCTDFFNVLVWWQQALGFLAFCAVWGGLVERYSRRYFARRRMRLRADQQTGLPRGVDAATAGAQASALSSQEGPGESSRDLVTTQRPQPDLPIVATAEFWDYAYERLFGRAADVVRVASDVAFALAIWYPGWKLKLLSFLVLLVASLSLGSWQRRRILSQRAPAASSRPSLR